jgi:Effector-associated domain 11
MGKWRLLAESKNIILKWWYILSLVLIIFVLLQQVFGKIEGIELDIWQWVFVNILPCAVLLNAYIIVNKYSDKALHPKLHGIMVGGVIGFLGLVFLTFFLSQAAIESNDYSLDVYFKRSYMYLLPMNLFLAIGIILVFYTKKNFLKPANEAIIEIAKTKEKQALEKEKRNRKACLTHLIANNFEKTFETMKNIITPKDHNMMQHLVLMQSQYAQLIKDKELNIIEPDYAQATLNRLTISLIDLAEKIDS